jgi:Asp/Glu/hydantoin racemase
MVEEDGAEVIIIMGCMAMAGYNAELEQEQELGVPGLDPLIVALKFVEAIVDIGKSHSRVGLCAPPMSREST